MSERECKGDNSGCLVIVVLLILWGPCASLAIIDHKIDEVEQRLERIEHNVTNR